MKATGIIRRIDDLGRIVIPKEIRRVKRIHENDPLEIFRGHSMGSSMARGMACGMARSRMCSAGRSMGYSTGRTTGNAY